MDFDGKHIIADDQKRRVDVGKRKERRFVRALNLRPRRGIIKQCARVQSIANNLGSVEINRRAVVAQQFQIQRRNVGDVKGRQVEFMPEIRRDVLLDERCGGIGIDKADSGRFVAFAVTELGGALVP